MPRSKEARDALKSIIEEDKPGYVKALFDSIAPEYDRMNWIMTGGLLALWHRAFARETKLGAGMTGLDICCGTGDLTYVMARLAGPLGNVVGLDFSERMLGIAKSRQDAMPERKRDRLAPIAWRHGDALRLPFEDGGSDKGFHCVSMGFALRNVADIQQSLREMARVARTGGRVVCLEVSRPKNPVIRAGFHLYFFRFVPWLGKWAERRANASGGRLAPYTYLPYSLEHLPPSEDILAMMARAGLQDVRCRPLTGGAVSLYIGTKR